MINRGERWDISKKYGFLALISAVLVLAAACIPAVTPSPTAVPTSVAKGGTIASPVPTVAPKPTATPTKRLLDKVNLAFASGSPSLVFPNAVAKEQGYYEQEGLDVEFVQVGAAISIKALIAGSHDFDTAVGSGVVAIIQGASLRVILASLTKAPWFIYAKPEIKSIAELKGKKIAVPTIGSALDVAAGVVLKKHGLDYKNDVIWVATGGGAAWGESLEAGIVDAGIFNSDVVLRLREKGFRELSVIGDEVAYVGGGLVATEKTVKERPDLVLRMVRASLKGLKYFQQRGEEMAQYYAKTLNMEPAKAKQLYELDRRTKNQDGIADEATIKENMARQKESLGTDTDIPLDKVFDMSFAKRANEELKQEGWKP
ncbi:MAG: ABC transporter substrate-binding protein [Dehalococcoidia bacterium]|nr:ABC transporter substrate-binding protein [Dehalococcoidia bacterium]